MQVSNSGYQGRSEGAMSVRINGLTNRKVDLSVQGLLLDIDRFATHDGPAESRLTHPALLYQDERCTACWLCLEVCPEEALTQGRKQGGEVAILDRATCTVCGKCAEVCYPGALKLAGNPVTVGGLVSEVEKDLPFFQSSEGGVTLSGGEPARQARFSYNFLLACKQRGIHTALETTGYASWKVMSALADVSDLLLYDVKLIDADAHQRYTGVPNHLILENLRRLARLGHEIQVRVPCIPGVNDDHEQVRSVARCIAPLGIQKMALLPYNGAAGAKYEWIGHQFTLSDKETQTEVYMNSLADLCRREGLRVQVGG
jgi:pyruvate formate lyase activating enzyme